MKMNVAIKVLVLYSEATHRTIPHFFQVEYMLVQLDTKSEKACLVLNGNKVLEMLQEKGKKANPK